MAAYRLLSGKGGTPAVISQWSAGVGGRCWSPLDTGPGSLLKTSLGGVGRGKGRFSPRFDPPSMCRPPARILRGVQPLRAVGPPGAVLPRHRPPHAAHARGPRQVPSPLHRHSHGLLGTEAHTPPHTHAPPELRTRVTGTPWVGSCFRRDNIFFPNTRTL